MSEVGYRDNNFSFNGVDIAELGLEYVPDLNNTYVYAPGAFDVSEEYFQAHDGGYFYGTTVKPKDFTLRCMFAFKHLNSGLMTRIAKVFERGTTGKLVFHNRPWCWYIATVVKEPKLEPTNYQNGIVTFTLRAYYPFARTTQTVIYDDDPNEESLLNNSAMMKGEEWDTSKDFGAMTAQKSIYVFNPGTERAATSIEIGGQVGTGVTIYNTSTQQSCKIVAFDGTQDNKTLIIDSLNGKVLTSNGSTTGYGFLYHDNGFIDLASNYPVLRDIDLSVEQGSNEFTATDPNVEFTDALIGKYVAFKIYNTTSFLGEGVIGDMVLNNYSNGESFYVAKITSTNGNSFATNKAVDLDGDQEGVEVIDGVLYMKATIATLNELVITPESDDMNLTKFVVRYLPTFN